VCQVFNPQVTNYQFSASLQTGSGLAKEGAQVRWTSLILGTCVVGFGACGREQAVTPPAEAAAPPTELVSHYLNTASLGKQSVMAIRREQKKNRVAGQGGANASNR
jgi:hypothetical protein